MKKIIATLLSVILALSSALFLASAEEEISCTNACDTVGYVLLSGETAPPIGVVRAKLTQGGEEKDIYLVGLHGTENIWGQVNVVGNYFLSVFCLYNSYTCLVKKVIKENVEKGAAVVLVGHSLGGMVAQQIASDWEIRRDYEIVGTLTAGSPYMLSLSPCEGSLNRLADINDAIPYISLAALVAPLLQLFSALYGNGGYWFNPGAAHNISYRQAEIWGKYDALGNKCGDAVITYNAEDISFYGGV